MAVNRSEAFQITALYEPNEARHKLIMCKGVYLYEYMDSRHFEETQLSDENINEADYAQQDWTTFGCNTA